MGTVLDRCKEFPVFVREGTCAVKNDKDQFRVFQMARLRFTNQSAPHSLPYPQTCRIDSVPGIPVKGHLFFNDVPRVVPGILETMARSVWSRRFRRLDLPTLGRPIMAIRRPSRRICPVSPFLRSCMGCIIALLQHAFSFVIGHVFNIIFRIIDDGFQMDHQIPQAAADFPDGTGQGPFMASSGCNKGWQALGVLS